MNNCCEKAKISLILRLAIGLLFGVAALAKFLGGLSNSASSIVGMLNGSFIPSALVSVYASALPFVEAAIAIWLILGVRLKEAWFCTALLLITLGFGLMAAKQNATDIYTYILISCAGLYFSQFDTCSFFKKK